MSLTMNEFIFWLQSQKTLIGEEGAHGMEVGVRG